MSLPVIEVSDLSKSFILSHKTKQRYESLREKISSALINSIKLQFPKSDQLELFYAIKSLSFSINKGDRIGIIGRNGAGKSTLLKLISRIVEPTSGSIKVKGRVASLLEVGTGFHPELSGRENIFLNGAILGMSRKEIKSKFDEIVSFAEVEKFLDTPVKRYSSGMYVRLAFAVAAHLEPEILIVDEVLAVGDTQFQKKCIGKMEDVSSKDGRTILFVSHNMGVISQLCNQGIFLKNGQLVQQGQISEIINSYVNSQSENTDEIYINNNSQKSCYFLKIYTCDSEKKYKGTFAFNENVRIYFSFFCNENIRNLQIGIGMNDKLNNRIFTVLKSIDELNCDNDTYSGVLLLPNNLFNPNFYSFDLAVWSKAGEVFEHIESVGKITIHDTGNEMSLYTGMEFGPINIIPAWEN